MRIQRFSTLTILTLLLFTIGMAIRVNAEVNAKIVSARKIWDAAPHNAFTDLVRFQGKFFCAFREGQGHAGDRGKLRIIVSEDGDSWKSAALLENEEYDLRDAALSVTPEGYLLVMGGAQARLNGGNHETGTFTSRSTNGEDFSPPKLVLPVGRWLWRVTWNQGKAYGVSYGTPENREASRLHVTEDGESFEVVKSQLLNDGEWPTEARIRFHKDGTAYCLHRRDGRTKTTAMLGIAEAPYESWSWHDLGRRLGGPNFVQASDGRWIVCGRLYDGGMRTELLELNVKQKSLTPIVRLPSGGDTSYPGMVWHNGKLWISYYSSHEGRTSIYLAVVAVPPLDDGPVDSQLNAVAIGHRLELFVDRHLIENMQNCTLRLHSPRPAEKVLRFDRPWEGPFCGYVSVVKDGSTYRLYYRGLPEAGGDGSDKEVTCYAESRDGIHWEKPNLGIHEVDGSGQNNIILKGETPASHNFSPFLDSNPNAKAEHRFKALGGTESSGLIAFVSPDGTHWRRMQEKAVFKEGQFDSQNVAFWSPAEKKYVCYFRTWTDGGYRGYRTVSRTTSKDFVHWTPPEPMEFGDTPYEHLYTNQTAPYFRAPHILLSTAARFMPGRKVLSDADAERLQVNAKYYNDCSDTVLMSSRGGTRYDRQFMESLIRPGLGLENWVSRTNYPALGIVPTSDCEMSLYLNKDYGQPTAYLQRYTLRTDGLTSVHASFGGGELLTKPILVGGDRKQRLELILNMSTSAAGSIRVELIDAATEKPLQGYGLDDCDELIGDAIERSVTWNGTKSLEDLSQPIRIRFVLKDADLYSFQFRSN